MAAAAAAVPYSVNMHAPGRNSGEYVTVHTSYTTPAIAKEGLHYALLEKEEKKNKRTATRKYRQ